MFQYFSLNISRVSNRGLNLVKNKDLHFSPDNFLNFILGLATDITQNRLNIFPEILKNFPKYHKKFLKISKDPLNIFCFV